MADTSNHSRPNQKELKAVVNKTDDILQKIFRLQAVRNAFVLQKSDYSADFHDINSLQAISILHDRIYTKDLFTIFDKYSTSVNALIDDKKIISDLNNPIKWFFAGNMKKDLVYAAYDRLAVFINNVAEFEQIYNNIIFILSRNQLDKKNIFQTNQKIFYNEFSSYFQVRPYSFPTSKLQQYLVPNSFYFDFLKLSPFYVNFDLLLQRKQFIDRNYFSSFETILRTDYENCRKSTLGRIANRADVSVLSPEISDRIIAKLKSAGINDLEAALRRNLTYIDGIGEVIESKIKTEARYYQSKLYRNNKKIRINIEEKPAEDTKLIKDIYLYKEFDSEYKSLNKLYLITGFSEVEEKYRNLQKNITGFNWFFAEEYRKQQFVKTLEDISDCYSRLSGKINESYLQLTAMLGFNLTDAAREKHIQRIWDDFENNSSMYYAIIEEVLGIEPDTGKIDDLLGKDIVADIKNTKVYVSSTLHLRPYQFFGAQYILNQGKVIVGDEMGLGKTIEAIAVMTTLKHNGRNRFLVVCPASIIANWEDEICRFSNLQVTRIRTEEAYRQWLKEGGVGIVSYNMVNKYTFSYTIVDGLIVDEAHFIKNESMRRYGVSKIIRSADNVILITGTPFENKVREMIGLIELINPELASKLSEKEKDSLYFKKAIASVYLRRKRDEVLSELPELIENVEWCEMTNEENKLYNNALRENSNPLAVFSRSKMALWNAQDSSKAHRLREILDMAAVENRKVLVFSEFLNILDRVKNVAADKYIGTIKGDVSTTMRSALIKEFNDHEGCCVMCMQILAGGVGINLQSASVVIICEPQWKPASEQQAFARAYRMGQTRNVLAYHLVATNKIEKYLISQSAEKANLFTEYADRGESTRAMNKQEYMNYLLEMERKNRGIEVLI